MCVGTFVWEREDMGRFLTSSPVRKVSNLLTETKSRFKSLDLFQKPLLHDPFAL